MSQPAETKPQMVRFEEVTPAHEDAAFFSVSIESLAVPLGLSIFESYDDLDELQLAFFTLKSGETVTLGEYRHCPEPGTALYVDSALQNLPRVVFDACQQLRVSRPEVLWFHPDWQEEIDRLYAEHDEMEKRPELSQVSELAHSNQYEPIDCFHHALRIYTRQEFPEYWAMLQHNLGLAYASRIQGNRIENLERSIACFNKSLEIFTQEKFPKKWKINQADLKKSQKSSEFLELELYKQSLAKDIIERPTPGRNLKDVDLRSAKLIGANLIRANFSNANLICAELQDADLSDANLSKAKLSGAELSGTNLNNANVSETLFGLNPGISESIKQELIERGAIFIDSSNDRSEFKNLVS
jgi:hypothetical protein